MAPLRCFQLVLYDRHVAPAAVEEILEHLMCTTTVTVLMCEVWAEAEETDEH
jgi:hypothetical protein